ncbi:MAG: metallophosphoesterase [Abditibacteriota bacterium]|nr:metallophosphoesterase [Abditibacteriota bacterium]
MIIFICVLAILCLIFGVWLFVEPYCIEIKNLELKFENLPKAFEGFSILFLSDIHTSKWGCFEKCLSEKLSLVKECDICVITGDLAYNEKATGNIPRLLSYSKIKGDTYVVLGNTEYKIHNNPEKLCEIYKGFGYVVLRNESTRIEREGEYISVIGVDDPINFLEDLPKAFKGVDENSFKILLSHCPSMGVEAVDYKVNLVLAGHTHGGQVKLPFFTVYTHMNRHKFFNLGLWNGEKLGKVINKKIENFWTVISNGLGTSVFRIRFKALPQIYRIVLKK